MANKVPDRPEISFNYAGRKSHSVANIFSANNEDYEKVKFRKDGEGTEKTIIFESSYDYDPERRDELKLKRGSTIRMIQRDCDEGWWYGETMDGKKGYFPQNHVQLAKGRAKEIGIDELKFTGCLGSGGFSYVKSAIYKNKEVAVKIPHSSHSPDKILEVVREEAGIFQMLSHVNILEMYGVVVGAELGLVLELCRDTLSNICSNSKNISLSEEIIGYWGAQIARGMKYLHDLNVLHRDLKAANVLIKEKVCECLLNGRSNSFDQMMLAFESHGGFCHECGGAALNKLTLKIADLGLSKKLQVAHCRRSFVGTVAYLAPEVIRDHKCSKAMDVWSFGVVLWEVLTGAIPFEGLERGAVLLQIGEFVKLTIPSWCPPDLARIIKWCWMDDAQKRPTFKELVYELEKFVEKFKTVDIQDETFLENSLNALRRNIKEMRAIANEISRSVQELQKREENVKKSERELELNKMIFELQQALLKEPPKEKPQPPKRMTRLKCSDISEPFGCKTEISLTKNFQLIKSATNLESSDTDGAKKDSWNLTGKEDVERLLSGFATLPRSLKKFTTVAIEENDLNSSPIVPSKSQPDLLEFCRTPSTSSNNSTANHELHRSNARRIKKDRLTTSTDENIDDKCIVVINDFDLENLLKNEEQSSTNLDYLATPRRSPVPVNQSRTSLDSRTSTETNGYPKSKGKPESKRFFKRMRIFKSKEKSTNVGGSSSLPRSIIMPVPLGTSIAGTSVVSASISPLKGQQHFEKKSSSKKLPTKTKKRSKTPNTSAENMDAIVLPNNSKVLSKVKGERKLSFAASVVNSLRGSTASSPARSFCDDTISVKLEPYERLSSTPDSSILENLSYVPHSLRDRASTSDASLLSSCIRSVSGVPKAEKPSGKSCEDLTCNSHFGIIENLSYRPPSSSKLLPTINSVLDSPVEGGLDDSERNVSTIFSTEGDGRISRSPLAISNKRGAFSPSLLPNDDALHPDNSSPLGSFNEADYGLIKVPGSPPYTIAPAPPLSQNSNPYPVFSPLLSSFSSSHVFRPQRPYTLDLNNSVTPTESGISTADSSYRSLSSVDCIPTDHAPPPPSDIAPRAAPPIPPRTIVRKSDDDNRSRHCTVTQTP